MSIVYKRRSGDRGAFIRKVFQELDVRSRVTGKNVLLKPNVVSHEPYPTTTHPETVETCLQLLLDVASKITVADGPAWDAGGSAAVIEGHPLRHSCTKYGVALADLLSEGARKVKTRSYELEVSVMASEHDFILSLPVLKSHGMGLTGALKNQLGFLPAAEKLRSHRARDMHLVVAELNEVVRPHLYIVDAVQTLVNTNEVRHGGQPRDLGYMLAGSDPVSLDVAGLEILKEVEPKLRGKSFEAVLHVKHAASLGIGETEYDITEL